MGLSEERSEQILLEEVLPRRRRTRNRSAEEAQLRRLIARDVAWMTKAGVIIDVPARWPDLAEPDVVIEEVQGLASADDPDGDVAVATEAAREAVESLRRRSAKG